MRASKARVARRRDAHAHAAPSIDEAIRLADTILLMTPNQKAGPSARVAEVVRNTLPRSRQRAGLHHEPQYYPIRNHLVDFLVNRSKEYQPREAGMQPPTVRPGLEADDKPRPTLVRVA